MRTVASLIDGPLSPVEHTVHQSSEMAVLMRVDHGDFSVMDERSDSDHFRLKAADEIEVFLDAFRRLIRRSDHESGSHLVADFLQVPETLLAVLKGQGLRMELPVMLLIGRLMPEEIAVGTRLKKQAVGFLRSFSERQRNRAVREALPDFRNQSGQVSIRKLRIFPALQDKCPEAEFISLPAAFEDFLLCQTVAADARAAVADAAVKAVISAVVADFQKTAYIDVRPVDRSGRMASIRSLIFQSSVYDMIFI